MACLPGAPQSKDGDIHGWQVRGITSAYTDGEMASCVGEHDPPKPHWHLKGLGVAPDFQGTGIGSQMVKFYCDIVDKDMIEAYHETDKSENLPFYERFGFKVVGEEIVNGSKNWYMLRPAKSDK